MSVSRRKRDHSQSTGGKAYKVTYLARKHGISREQAERIIERAGGSRKRADALCTLIKKQFLVA